MSVQTIEDLLEALTLPSSTFDRSSFNEKDRSILFSMASQLSKKNLALTENQANLALKILRGNPAVFTFVPNATTLLDNPVFKNPFRVIDNKTRISIIENNGKRVIAFKHYSNRQFVENIQKISGKRIFDSSKRSYYFDLNEQNIIDVYEIFENFEFDQEFLNFVEQIKEIRKNLPNYVPSATVINGEIKLKNVNRTVENYFENNRTDNFLNNVMLLKLMKIHFDDSLNLAIENANPSKFTKDLLISKDKKFFLDPDSHKDDAVKTISELDAYPVLMLMPEDRNIVETFAEWLEIFSRYGIKNHEISVLFRSNSNKTFNALIKDQKLNNLVTGQTKFVIANHKIPKILYKIGFYPRLILNTTTVNAHYSSQRMVESHALVLYYNELAKTFGR